jgi:hypothetical protein
MRVSDWGLQALLFPGNSIHRAALLKRIAVHAVLDWINTAKAHPGSGAPALLMRVGLPW